MNIYIFGIERLNKMAQDIAGKSIGRIAATKERPNTAYDFYFWTSEDSKVGIGTLVYTVAEDKYSETGTRTAYGIVVEGWGYTDLETPLHDYIGSEGDPSAEAATERPEIRLYRAAVLRVEPEEPLKPVSVGPVYLSDDERVCTALRMDEYREKSGIPIGLYQNGEELSPVYLDADFLLGPEAAHLNCTGVSGLATKTSAIEFILSSIFAHFDKPVAVVCFNVKGPDMLFLDLPANADEDCEFKSLYEMHGIANLNDEDKARFARMKIPCEPFKKVEYYAPYKPDRVNLNTLRSNEKLRSNVYPLSWGLNEVMKFTEVLLNRDDVDAKADALIQFIRQRVIDQESKISEELDPMVVRDFADLQRWFDAVLEWMEKNNQQTWQTHNYATIRKIYNRLSNLTTRYKGLISSDDCVQDLPWGDFKDRTIYVIDVANLDPQAQDLVFTRVVHELRERLEKKNLGVEHVVVVVDELNKYAPSDGHETYLKQTLLDISERGRYLGLVLFSAQQFRSQVHKRVVGNSATCIYGRMDMDELSTPGYQVLTSATKEKLATLSKGQLMVRHPHFTQPIFVKFPRPNILRGPDGIKMFPPEEDLPLGDAVWRNLKNLDDDIDRLAVKDIVAECNDPDEIIRAMNITLQKRPNGNVLAYFESCIRKKPNARACSLDEDKITFEQPISPDPDDPFAY